jgi:hypothetical protein
MPLVLIRNADADFHVMSGSLRVGRIYKRQTARPEIQWLWALNGVYGGPDAMRITGKTSSSAERVLRLKATRRNN